MSDFLDAMADLNAAELESFGVSITYRVNKGAAAPIDALAILRKPAVMQSSAPGYFGDIDVDPAVISDPQLGDVVVWTDGVEYVVARVINPPYGLMTLAIHRRTDA